MVILGTWASASSSSGPRVVSSVPPLSPTTDMEGPGGALADIRARLRSGDRLRGARAAKGGDPAGLVFPDRLAAAH
ncbi:MAG: hypothetical protein WCP70_13960 [Methanothrix sp.]